MPRAPGGAFGVRASSMCTMFSDWSWKAPVVHILSPRIRYSPAAAPAASYGVAIVRIVARLEPACGSESAIVPKYSAVRSCGR